VRATLGVRGGRSTALRTDRWLGLEALALMVLFSWWTSTAMALSGGGSKVVRYRGYRIVVPPSWPVYDLTSHPRSERVREV
jgi:hypothetical protein